MIVDPKEGMEVKVNLDATKYRWHDADAAKVSGRIGTIEKVDLNEDGSINNIIVKFEVILTISGHGYFQSEELEPVAAE